jgi:hypothetical protein
MSPADQPKDMSYRVVIQPEVFVKPTSTGEITIMNTTRPAENAKCTWSKQSSALWLGQCAGLNWAEKSKIYPGAKKSMSL